MAFMQSTSDAVSWTRVTGSHSILPARLHALTVITSPLYDKLGCYQFHRASGKAVIEFLPVVTYVAPISLLECQTSEPITNCVVRRLG